MVPARFHVEPEPSPAAFLLDLWPLGVMVVDERRRIDYVNQSARQVLAAQDGLRSSADRLDATDADESIRLGRLIAAAVSSDAGDAVHVMLVTGRTSRRHVRVIRLPDRVAAARVAVLVSGTPALPAAGAAMLAALYGLTATEARVAMLMAHGHGMRAVAVELGIAYETARSYAKRVLQKTGVRRQSELTALLACGPIAVQV